MSYPLFVELGCEELPPIALKDLSNAFATSFIDQLTAAKFSIGESDIFATPRRIGFIIHNVSESQPDQRIEKLGPNVAAAFDDEGKPKPAALGFAKSCGVSIDQIERVDTDKGQRLAYTLSKKGQTLQSCFQAFLDEAIKSLPIPKRMRWGSSREEFARPTHWLCCLYNDEVIEASATGIASDNMTQGHRFHAPERFAVSTSDYVSALEQRKVIPSFSKRRDMIKEGILTTAKSINGHAQISDKLLDEVTALVEWPVPLLGKFEESFLEVPKEALISSMESHQKYFHLLDSSGNLMPYFITISNISSTNSDVIIEGNERVIRPRLADAAFFFSEDKKTPLADRVDDLKSVTFQHKLGSLYDKSQRIKTLAMYIAQCISADVTLAGRAAELCKTDLLTDMVGEFPDLQGIMGKYYAACANEPQEVADALFEQYLPKSFDDENLPRTLVGQSIAIADRADTLVGIFSIGAEPTGNKDPFGLRRASLTLLKIILHFNLPIDLKTLFTKSAETLPIDLQPFEISKALDYTLDRFKSVYTNQGIRTEVYLAVTDSNLSSPCDIDARILALDAFDKTQACESLAKANKRVVNLLSKNADAVDNSVVINPELFQESAEQDLFKAIQSLENPYSDAVSNADYAAALNLLSSLKEPVDNFFDQVMIMVDDAELKANRLCILHKLKTLFTSIANIALLSKS